jgi:hypothetical protein
LFQGLDEMSVLRTVSKEANADSILLSKSKELVYKFDTPVYVPSGYSLEIQYSFSVLDNASSGEIESYLADWENHSSVEITFCEEQDSANQDSWILPVSLRSIGLHPDESFPQIISYTIPLQNGTIDSFSINVKNNDSPFSREKIFLTLESFKVVPRWYGIVEVENQLKFTPFVYLDEDNIVTISPPEQFRMNHSELMSYGLLDLQDLYVNIDANHSYPIEVFLRNAVGDVVLQSSENRAFPLLPITLSASDSVSFDQNKWRRKNFEVFRWEQFPSILIFDTANYDVQDRLVKRLAFFVEKAGFEGQLSTDEEIAGLHGWNAHDYRAEDLARFFETARITNFPLNIEELELQQILLEQKIIVQDVSVNDDSKIVPGSGAIVSISRESPEYLRYRFIVHESYHGLYFIDKEFEDFCRSRWENLNPTAKAFILQYFAYMQYDTNNVYLMANELMAYCLQQSVANAGTYFGTNLAGTLDTNQMRRHVLPPKDEESNSWPLIAELFTQETRAFSDYVNQRWGLRAGTLRQ